MIIMAYLREGRVHRDREAFEGGDGVAAYTYIADVEGNGVISARIGADEYTSVWAWPLDAKRPYGAVPLMRNQRKS